MAEKLNLEICKERIATINPKIKITATEYLGASKPLPCECLVCRHPWSPKWNSLQQGHGCPKCREINASIKFQIPTDENRFSNVRPDLVGYFKYSEDANNCAINSGIAKEMICIHCGLEKMVEPQTLNKYGFACSQCSDGISMPEKFVFGLLKSSNIEFDAQKIFEWAKDKRYDFYIPSLNIIIEAHGDQHYRKTNFNGSTTLKEQKENDIEKHNLARSNGITDGNYIVIDCRYSTPEWLEKNAEDSLKHLIDFKSIDFDIIYKYCTRSIVATTWALYNQGLTLDEISQELKRNRYTVIKDLKFGTKIGKCNYVGLYRPVEQYTLDNEFIEWHLTMTDASNKTGVYLNSISLACKGVYKQAGGFIWRYSDLNYYAER